MAPPLAEMAGWLRQGVGALIRQAWLRSMKLLLEESCAKWEKNKRPQPGRTANRWCKAQRSYEMFHRGELEPAERNDVAVR